MAPRGIKLNSRLVILEKDDRLGMIKVQGSYAARYQSDLGILIQEYESTEEANKSFQKACLDSVSKNEWKLIWEGSPIYG